MLSGAFEEDQDVDVGKQRQMPPPVASEGQDGDRLRRLRRFEEQALQQRVDPVGVALDGCRGRRNPASFHESAPAAPLRAAWSNRRVIGYSSCPQTLMAAEVRS